MSVGFSRLTAPSWRPRREPTSLGEGGTQPIVVENFTPFGRTTLIIYPDGTEEYITKPEHPLSGFGVGLGAALTLGALGWIGWIIQGGYAAGRMVDEPWWEPPLEGFDAGLALGSAALGAGQAHALYSDAKGLWERWTSYLRAIGGWAVESITNIRTFTYTDF